MDTDFSLIRRMKSGEEESFDTFVRKYYPDILKYCHYHGPRSCGEDLTQAVFIRFFQNLSGYSHIGKARNYLYTIAANLCRDAYKKKTEIPSEFPAEGQCAPEARTSGALESEGDPADRLSEKLLIEAALAKLSEEMREVIVLHYFQDMKLRDMAAVLKISLPLVKYRLSRAKKQLEALLREEEEA